MIRILKKPTDTPDDNSTGAVVAELDKLNVDYSYLNLDETNPFALDIEGDLIWVCGMKQDMVHFEMLTALENCNLVVNSPSAIAICASKAQTTARLIHNNIPTPETLFTGSLKKAEEFLNIHKKIVYKPLYGYDGNGIYPLTSMEEMGKYPYYLQEFVNNTHDFRVFVLNGKAIGAIQRSSDSFAHNIHQGGTGKAIEIPDKMAEIAISAAKAIGIDYCGVDLLPVDGGFTVLEVNGTPNWHCMSAPIPKLIARYLVKKETEYC